LLGTALSAGERGPLHIAAAQRDPGASEAGGDTCGIDRGSRICVPQSTLRDAGAEFTVIRGMTGTGVPERYRPASRAGRGRVA